jgi:glycosyltransferase involved in cell wall biosynthesis
LVDRRYRTDLYRDSKMHVAFEVSALYPHNAGTHTYGVQLLTGIADSNRAQDVTLFDVLGRRNFAEILETNGLALQGIRFARAPKLPTLSCTNCRRLPRLRSSRWVREFDRFTLKLLWQRLCDHPRASEWLIPASVVRSMDVCHWAGAVFRPLSSVPTVRTVHDLLPLSHPEWFVPEHRAYEVHQFELVRRYATRIIASSQSTRNDLIQLLGVDSSRIDVVPLAAAPRFKQCQDENHILDTLFRYGLEPEKYVFHVGTVEPRKNLVRLAEGFLVATSPDQESGLKLVMAGGEGWLTGPIHEGLRALNPGERIKMLGRVPEEDLPALLQGALAVAATSLSEGFGLPALEAMASGGVVIASNTGSAPEVVGEAGLLVNPYDVSEIADGLKRLIGQPALRSELRDKGTRRAKLFSWSETTDLTIETYRRAVNSFSSRRP